MGRRQDSPSLVDAFPPGEGVMAILVEDKHGGNPEVFEEEHSPQPCNPKNNIATAAEAARLRANQAFLVMWNYWEGLFKSVRGYSERRSILLENQFFAFRTHEPAHHLQFSLLPTIVYRNRPIGFGDGSISG